MCYINTIKGCCLCDINNIIIYVACNKNENINICKDIHNCNLDYNENILYIENHISSNITVVCSECAYKIKYNKPDNIYSLVYNLPTQNRIITHTIVSELQKSDVYMIGNSAVCGYFHGNDIMMEFNYK